MRKLEDSKNYNTNLEIDIHYIHNYVNYLNSNKPTGQTDSTFVISPFFLQTRCLPLVKTLCTLGSCHREETGGSSVAVDSLAIYITATINT